MSSLRLKLLISFCLLWIAAAQPQSLTGKLQHHSSTNRIKNSCFKISNHSYHPLSTTLKERYVRQWRQLYSEKLEISTQNDFQQIIQTAKFDPKQINMCVLRSTRMTQINQILSLQAHGWFLFKITIVAGSANSEQGSLIVVIQGDAQFSSKQQLIFLANGEEQKLQFYVKIPLSGLYHFYIFLGKANHNSVIAGISQVGFFSCSKTQVSFFPSKTSRPKKQHINLVGNGDFSFPKVSTRKDSIKIFANGAKPWFTYGMGRIVKCSTFNPKFECNQAYLFSKYPQIVRIYQSISVLVEGKYELSFVHTQTLVSSLEGEISVQVNEQLIWKGEVASITATQRFTPKQVTKTITLIKGLNSLFFVGQNFLVEKAGLMITDVRVRLISEVPVAQLVSLTIDQPADTSGMHSTGKDEEGKLGIAAGGSAQEQRGQRLGPEDDESENDESEDDEKALLSTGQKKRYGR